MNTVTTKSSDGENFYLFGVEGRVKSILTKYKAILTFERDGKEETAILFAQKLTMKFDSDGDSIRKFISEGESIMFDCHTYKRFGNLPPPEYSKEICGFFVVKAWLKKDKVKSKDEEEIFKSDSSSSDEDPKTPPRHQLIDQDSKTEAEERAISGIGSVGGFLDTTSGIIWWKLRQNHYQSVLFNMKHLDIVGGSPGSCDDISRCVSKDDQVEFEAVRNKTGPTNCNWVAKKVRIGKSDKKADG